ncbi:MAG TPA: SpoIID/LytB domain-containing protein [Thermoanaerobaculales bacterium]|nr:SpoIID/LytB domain-containing protein [Thermoanaerobaculales bacterium]
MRLAAGAVGALLALTGCATAPSPAPPPTTPSPAPTRPSAVAAPPQLPTPPAPAFKPDAHTDPPLIRVLIARTREGVELAQPGRAYRLRLAEDRESWLFGPLRLAAVPGGRSWQVGAFRGAAAADAAARRIEAALGGDVTGSVTEAPDGLLRVRARWRGAEPADPAAVLAGAGFPGAFAVTAPGLLRVEGSNGVIDEIAGEVVVDAEDGWPIAVDGGHYHGRLRVRVATDEVLVINQLNLESYLRGVVPAEMGPVQFPQLDALKAQAVAARTYAIAHLGDAEAEGYDLCATPACQVYAGADAQHPLSDRAVDETAGLIAVFGGEPIDAMYTSTCGGHTEDAALLFEGRAQPYLRGVPCAWDRPLELVGSGEPQRFHGESEFRAHLASRALGLPSEAEPQQVVARVAAACGGRMVAGGRQAGPDELAAALIAAGGLDGATALVDGQGAAALAELADLYDIPLEVPEADVRRHGWQLRAALAVLELRGVVRRDAGEAVPHPAGVAIFPRNAPGSEPLPQPLPLYRRWTPVWSSEAALTVLPGTALERYWLGDRLLAVVAVQSGGGGLADRRSAWRSWYRDRTWEEVARGLGVPDLERLEITSRGPSGRVVGLKAVGRSGAEKAFEGFPIRRALDLPENLFSFHVTTAPDGTKTVRFLGRAWGHGVGLCQNGAFGLARSGMTFEEILKHYYTGIELVRWEGK